MDMYLDVEFDFALYPHSINQPSKGRVYSLILLVTSLSTLASLEKVLLRAQKCMTDFSCVTPTAITGSLLGVHATGLYIASVFLRFIVMH